MMKNTLLAIATTLSFSTQAVAQSDTAALALQTPGGNLYGTLRLPATAAEPGKNEKIPVMLIIAGSGPTDRDGNALSMGLHSDIYKQLADSLALHGIASLRYDKRGVGASRAALKSESDIRFGDGIDDAVGFLKLLHADHRFSSIFVFGHSEGSLVGMVAAGRQNVDGFISAAGAGDRIDKVIERQLAAQSPALAEQATVIFDSLAAGQLVKDPPKALMALFRPSVQPYMISWLKYDPRQEIGKLKMPVLIIQGETDLQTSVNDARLLKQGKPDATLLIIPKMNHVFREVGMDLKANYGTYTDPHLPLKQELVKAIVGFIRKT